ncbi:hypothetical protein E2562_027954 [Oryza meyeriana var. granulata]|uniref:Uncharacterized protein n=1 Tax=Oryza meyeriana var. granulata TaxID=110450 RepID=A0A6G1CTQ9_9ORYZ|nr:hypothetical protein E2562_027954 [Oryza meyeriana var. granulata]
MELGNGAGSGHELAVLPISRRLGDVDLGRVAWRSLRRSTATTMEVVLTTIAETAGSCVIGGASGRGQPARRRHVQPSEAIDLRPLSPSCGKLRPLIK